MEGLIKGVGSSSAKYTVMTWQLFGQWEASLVHPGWYDIASQTSKQLMTSQQGGKKLFQAHSLLLTDCIKGEGKWVK